MKSMFSHRLGQQHSLSHMNRKPDSRKFWGKMILSIDIGQHTTKLVLGRAGKDSFEVKQTHSFRTPSGSVENGRILDLEPLVARLEQAVKEQKLKAKYVFGTLENAEIVTREIVLPSTDANSMQNMLQLEVQQYMPIELDNYLTQARYLDSFDENGVQKTRFLATAVPKDLAQTYFDLFQRVGLKAAVLDIQSNSIGKLACMDIKAAEPNIPKDQSVAIIDFGYTHINVVLIEDGRYQFNRFIGQGAVSIDRDLRSFFDYSDEEIEQSKASGIRLNQAAADPDHPAAQTEQETFREDRIVKNVVNDWTSELERVFRYYTSRSKGKTVQKIFIHGGTAQMDGFDSYLAKELGVPVERVQKLSGFSFQSSNTQSNGLFLNAIGAFIRR